MLSMRIVVTIAQADQFFEEQDQIVHVHLSA
jgi:hypothetical protein